MPGMDGMEFTVSNDTDGLVSESTDILFLHSPAKFVTFMLTRIEGMSMRADHRFGSPGRQGNSDSFAGSSVAIAIIPARNRPSE